MVFGSFDPLHDGHRNMFQQAKNYGDMLIVVVARDATIREVKKHEPHLSEEERLKEVEKVLEVDKAILGSLGDKYEVIKEHVPNVICLGYDQSFFVTGMEELLKAWGPSIQLVRLKPYQPERLKSSMLRD